MARTAKMYKATAVVTGIIVVSKLFGFIRDMITANYFGTGMENDAYVAAYSLFYLPILLFNSCITSTLIPMFVEARIKKNSAVANRFGSNALNMFSLFALIVSAVMFVFARPLVSIVFSGFGPERMDLTIKLTRIMMVSVTLNVVAIVLTSLLNAREKYLTAQLTGTGFPLNAAIIIAAAVFSKKYGVTALAWGVTCAGFLQVFLQIPCMRGWFRYTPYLNLHDRRLKKLMALALPAILSMAVSELNHMIDHLLASGLAEGSISALNYGYKLISFVIGVLVVPLTTVIFSKLSKLVAKGDRAAIRDILRRAIELIALVIIPITIIACIMRVDIIRFAYGRGAFDENSISVTSGAFMFYMLGVLGFGLRDVVNRVFHSMQDTRTPFRVAICAVIANIILNIILRALMGVNGLALATSISGTAAMVALVVLLRKKLGRLRLRRTLIDCSKTLVAGVICGIVCYMLSSIVPVKFGTMRVFLRLAVTSGGSLIAYALMLILLGERQIRSLTGDLVTFNRRKHR